jgi:glycosyltransferase involved in cell wall biosynthesis
MNKIKNEESIFLYTSTDENKTFGTEQIAEQWKKNVLLKRPEMLDYNWLLMPGFFNYEKKLNVVWNHIEINQSVENVYNEFKNIFDAHIFVSHWQYREYIKRYFLDESKCFVAKNAIVPIPKHKKPNNNIINIVYFSDDLRGLDILFESLRLIPEETDIRVHVYRNVNYTNITTDNRVIFHEKVSNDELRKDLQNMHIFAYPCTFPETSCISLMEAMSAGCYCIVSDVGALPETGSNLVHMYEYNHFKPHHIEKFANELKKGLNIFRSGKWNSKLQIEFANKAFSWKTRAQEWMYIADELQKINTKNSQYLK